MLLQRLAFRLTALTNIRRKATAAQPISALIATKEVNDKGVLTLNRPDALNAVNIEMAESISATLRQWQNTKSLVLLNGAGGKAFCAGGDIRSMVEADSTAVGKELFRTEYVANYTIATLNIPCIAIIDGITMGAGLGLSINSTYQVATERTVFAMPEVSVGHFPDAGGSYFLPRMKGKIGLYLALTSAHLKGRDVVKVGVATHYCDSAKVPEVERALLELKNANDAGKLLDELCPVDNSVEFGLADHLEQINKCFSASTIEGILANLEEDGSTWAEETIQVGTDQFACTTRKIILFSFFRRFVQSRQPV